MSEHSPAPTPSRAVYGFAFHLASRTAFALYLLWGFVLPMLPPSVASLPYISQLPQPYWAVAIPIHACVALATFAFLIYPGINLTMTPAPDDMRTIRDSHSRRLPLKSKHTKGIPPVGDLDISHVCRTLYLNEDL
ncbi:phosphatidylinositol N-acetylglucosaminyltransferase subunit P [Hetaerina americana]|uniref:phosphatidylinositol N-acetylglucosaminyltransferase subunit P n=1 Tax=Hetaerina americana TaxID=62018 RepID=UPI003A7F1FDB